MKDELEFAYLSGRLPKSMLAPLSWAPKQYVLLGMPSIAIEELNLKYRERFGVDLTVNYSYRSWLRQVAVRLIYGNAAAPVGQSMHGFGLALDLGGGIEKSRSEENQWMQGWAPAFGWRNPEWAQPFGSRPEAWHWEFS